MAVKTNYYKRLLQRYLDNDCTPQEVEAVLHFLQQDGAARVLLEQMQAAFDQAMDQDDFLVPAAVSQKVQRRLMEKIGPTHFRKPLFRRIGFRVAAAALLVLLLGAGVHYLFLNTSGVKQTAGHDTPAPAVPATQPGRNKAYITMANGEQIVLDSASGLLAQQGNANILQLANGQITYQPDSLLTPDSYPDRSSLAYNTLTVPRGGSMVTLTLADGTRVWVNTASSIRYPTVFTGHERVVELTGEAYFEVSPLPATPGGGGGKKPFIVSANGMQVRVLGTEFNVSAYEDEEQHQVVLLKGSVNVTANPGKPGQAVKKGPKPETHNLQLLPNQMASYTHGGKLTVTNVNTEEYTSWTKGYLILKHTPWEQLMRRLSRYYDVRIHTVIPAFKEETFSGRLDLQANLEDMMNLICTGTPFIYQPTERKLIRRMSP